MLMKGLQQILLTYFTTQNDWYGTFTKGIFDRMTYDGKIYAVPTNFAAALVFYNTEIFDKCGVTVPTTLMSGLQPVRQSRITDIHNYMFSRYSMVPFNDSWISLRQGRRTR